MVEVDKIVSKLIILLFGGSVAEGTIPDCRVVPGFIVSFQSFIKNAPLAPSVMNNFYRIRRAIVTT